MSTTEGENHKPQDMFFVRINIKIKMQSRVPELSYFGDTLKKQHLRKTGERY